jgi:hypothetical protein
VKAAIVSQNNEYLTFFCGAYSRDFDGDKVVLMTLDSRFIQFI